MTDLINDTDKDLVIPSGELIEIGRMFIWKNDDDLIERIHIERIGGPLQQGKSVPTTTACPECDMTRIYKRETKDLEWRCAECGHEFNDPNRRPKHPAGRKKSSKP